MKKLLLLITAVTFSLAAMPQKGKVTSALSYIDQGILDKAKENIDQALQDESTSNWFNTFFAKGKLAQATYQSDNPKFKSFYSDPLGEAYAAYEKALELDTKGSTKKKIITQTVYNSLAVDLYNEGSAKFEAKDFEGALKSFETQIKITESDKYVGMIDTGMYYNAGLAAVNSKKFNEGIKYFQKCADMKYLGITPYYQIYECYLGLGDTVKAESILTDLPKMFPDDKTITLQLIDLYIKSNKNEEALKYIEVAKKDDPNNYSVYYAAGIIHLNADNFDPAITELSKAVELNPDVFDTQYGCGVAYINKAAAMFQKANDIMDVKKYSEAIDEANIVYAKALPFIEKAYELKPDDIYNLKALQELYYRLKQKDPSLAPKYETIKAKVAAIEGK
jgi:tetratricopeptide (TPR) repeat protein